MNYATISTCKNRVIGYRGVRVKNNTVIGPYAKKGAPSIKELLPKDSEELPKGTT